MCGIVGFNWNNKRLGEKTGKLLKHRGPDGNGYYSDDNVTLGHRRLSIIDLSENGRQPMSDQEEKLWITFNGEIFNFQELKKELGEFSFKSKTDTEVLLYGYKKYGIDILEKINGQFAFCIYDKEKELLFLARDRTGINPLYYYTNEEKFIFGSELKVLMELGAKKEINPKALNFYLMYGHTPGREAILEKCFKIEPAHYLIYDLKEKKIREYKRYWDVNFESKIDDEETAKKLILEKLDESVKKRLVGDVPVGAFLSGGLDSSAIVSLMSKYTKNLNTFSIKFDYQDFDESKYADIISKKFNTKHHVIEFGAEDVRKLIEELTYYYDEPFGDPSMVPTFLVSKVARMHVTVSLSGDGGDELFGGYNSYKQYSKLMVQEYYPKIVNNLMLKALKNKDEERYMKIKTFFEIGKLRKEHRYPRLMSYLSRKEFKIMTGEDPEEYYDAYAVDSTGEGISKAIDSDIRRYLPEDILTKVDRASLANSLESRPPILDHEVLELAAKIDPRLKIKNGEGKYIFKKTFEGILPDEIIYRKKKGFAVPLKHYLRGELKDIMDKYFYNYKTPYVKEEFKNYIRKKFENEGWGKDYSKIVWRIIILNLWTERWINHNHR